MEDLIDLVDVFPACAGVIRDRPYIGTAMESLSRMRGGDPEATIWRRYARRSFPHARG